MVASELLDKIGNVREIRRLKEHLEVMLSMTQARYFLERMKRTAFEPTMESLFEIDGNLLGFSVSYGRAFLSTGPGRTILKPETVYGTTRIIWRCILK